ncbi:hypothetical protein PVAG01_03813 [Phlyctema vagabunda]|uniref:Rhodopsin domain-containing protein n=1 Tax=Phlyctema vagabunda TaxID=108571 RepID=A0ABR4PMG9_9HELO
MAVNIEQWTEYGIGQFVFLLRFYCRWRVVGIRNFAWDDFFAFIAMLMWISDTVTVQIISDHGAFVGLTPETVSKLTDDEIANMETGSKALFVAWLSYVTLIWSLKASVLCFYSRLTLGLWQQKFVKLLIVPVVLTYLASMLTLFLHCTPIQKNWQVKPFAGEKCTLFVANYIVVIIGNVCTDLAILYIPLPMIWAVKIPIRRKLAISVLLSSGVFVIIAAILRCVLSLKYVDEVGASTIWGIRETFIAVLAISAAAIKPYFSRNRWTGSSGSNKPGHMSTGVLDRSDLKKGSVKIPSGSERTVVKSWNDKYQSDIELGLNSTPSRNGSQDEFVSSDLPPRKLSRNSGTWKFNSETKDTKKLKPKSSSGGSMKIQVTTTFVHDDSELHSPVEGALNPTKPSEVWSPHGGSTTMVSAARNKTRDR